MTAGHTTVVASPSTEAVVRPPRNSMRINWRKSSGRYDQADHAEEVVVAAPLPAIERAASTSNALSAPRMTLVSPVRKGSSFHVVQAELVVAKPRREAQVRSTVTGELLGSDHQTSVVGDADVALKRIGVDLNWGMGDADEEGASAGAGTIINAHPVRESGPVHTSLQMLSPASAVRLWKASSRADESAVDAAAEAACSPAAAANAWAMSAPSSSSLSPAKDQAARASASSCWKVQQSWLQRAVDADVADLPSAALPAAPPLPVSASSTTASPSASPTPTSPYPSATSTSAAAAATTACSSTAPTATAQPPHSPSPPALSPPALSSPAPSFSAISSSASGTTLSPTALSPTASATAISSSEHPATSRHLPPSPAISSSGPTAGSSSSQAALAASQAALAASQAALAALSPTAFAYTFAPTALAPLTTRTSPLEQPVCSPAPLCPPSASPMQSAHAATASAAAEPAAAEPDAAERTTAEPAPPKPAVPEPAAAKANDDEESATWPLPAQQSPPPPPPRKVRTSEIGARPPEIGARPPEIGARPPEIRARPPEIGARPSEIGASSSEVARTPGASVVPRPVQIISPACALDLAAKQASTSLTPRMRRSSSRMERPSKAMDDDDGDGDDAPSRASSLPRSHSLNSPWPRTGPGDRRSRAGAGEDDGGLTRADRAASLPPTIRSLSLSPDILSPLDGETAASEILRLRLEMAEMASSISELSSQLHTLQATAGPVHGSQAAARRRLLRRRLNDASCVLC